MEVYFVLDEQGDPVPVSDLDVWREWFERADRGMARTAVTPDIAVLTTFSGVVEAAENQQPLLFATRVFGGILDGEELQHPTLREALAAHAALVGWCRVGSSPDGGVTQAQLV